jgi:hypothetical protein
MAEGAEKIVGVGQQGAVSFYGKGRLLALEVRPHKLGFVVFEGPARLLDWGVRSCIGRGKRLEASVAKGIDPLLKLYAPSTLVMRSRHSLTWNTRVALRRNIKTVRRQAQVRLVDVHLLTNQKVKLFFAKQRAETKHQIASTLVGWFEELAWKLPQKRRLWQSENHNMVIFDAAATGIAFFGKDQSSQSTYSR